MTEGWPFRSEPVRERRREPQVLAPSHVAGANALGVAHPQGADFVVDRPGDHRPGGPVVGLADAPLMAGLLASLGPPQLAPAPRPPLASGRGLSPHPPCPG